jgi:hypothetical protein
VTFKVVLEAACDPGNCFESLLWMYWRKSLSESEGKPEQKFDAAFGKNFSVIIFKKGRRNFLFIFSLRQGRLQN